MSENSLTMEEFMKIVEKEVHSMSPDIFETSIYRWGINIYTQNWIGIEDLKTIYTVAENHALTGCGGVLGSDLNFNLYPIEDEEDYIPY